VSVAGGFQLIDLASILVGLGSGAIIGFILGYAFRRLLAVLIFSLGVFIAGLILLVNSGLAYVDFQSLGDILYRLFIYGLNTGNQLVDKAFSGVPFTIGLLSGVGAGLFKARGFLTALQRGRRRALRDA
jgi:uncharacterized membrane protein (Fun14 family)